MKSFLEWLKADPEKEIAAKNSLNMTAGLPGPGGKNIFDFVGGLTRGFHLNTVIGRMMTPWTNTLTSENWQALLAPNLKGADGKPNENFMAAYDLFKNEIAMAVRDLPGKTGRDVRTGRDVDVLAPAKDFFRGYEGESEGYITHLGRAFEICMKVFPKKRFSSVILQQTDNFRNFLELVRDEFMTFGERLPSMREGGLERSRAEEKKINREIRKYESLRSRVFSGLYG